MRKSIVVVITSMICGVAYNATAAHWEYAGDKGPQHWGKLSPEFSACSMGKNQSPINLGGFIEADLQPIGFDYKAGGNEIVNNGHSVQVNYTAGSQISVDDQVFELKQYHFHAPSENHINGKSYPMEAHLVHADKDGNLAVVAVMFEQGKANESLARAWELMPQQAGGKHRMTTSLAVDGILPASRDYYRFNGSLTTPPCTEGVRWFVMKQPMTASQAQIAKFAGVLHHPNNRPVQAVNARPVLQ